MTKQLEEQETEVRTLESNFTYTRIPGSLRMKDGFAMSNRIGVVKKKKTQIAQRNGQF